MCKDQDTQNYNLAYCLYGCGTWSFKFMEVYRVGLFENKVLRRIFGPKMGEVTEEWMKLHNENLNYRYCRTNIVTVIKWSRMSWVGHVSHMGETRHVYWALVGTPEGKRTVGRSDIEGRIILR